MLWIGLGVATFVCLSIGIVYAMYKIGDSLEFN